MGVEVGKLYFVSLKYPGPLNDPSPLKPQPPPTSYGWCSVNAEYSRNIRRGYGHVGLLLHYDESSKLGAILLGTSRPHQPHRFVPWYGTPRISSQPLVPLEPDPLDSFLEWPGYLNFTHAVLVKVIEMNDPISPSFPGMALVRDLVVGSDVVDIFVRPSQIAHLYALHSEYWSGKRYSDDTMDNPPRGDDGGAGGTVPKSTGSGGASRSGASSGSGASSSTQNPVHPRTGLPHSTMVKLAMEQERQRFRQAQLLDGELDGDNVVDPIPCTLTSLTRTKLQELSETNSEDDFPFLGLDFV